MTPLLPRFGITRIARLTGLDVTGIPCWSACRPMSLSLSLSQGKGVTDDAARASAIMEAVETAVAERPVVGTRIATAAHLDQIGEKMFDPRRMLPFGTTLDANMTLTWVKGQELFGGGHIWLPRDLVDLDSAHEEMPSVCKNSNGLASGNTLEEAVFHALCELIERDATTLWSLRTIEMRRRTALDPSDFNDPIVRALCERILAGGDVIRIFDQTTDLKVPVVMALVGPESVTGATRLSVAAGYGAHPIPVRAAIRAITEAAQSRVTSIAGARDDIEPDAYTAHATAEAAELLAASPASPVREGMELGAPLPNLLAYLGERCLEAEVWPICVRLNSENDGFAVVKVLSNELEDRGPNLHWRPGTRAVEYLLQ